MEPKIYSKIIAIMRDCEAVSKDQKNTMQNYKFRGIDDIYNVMHPLFSKHGVFMTTEVLDDVSEERTNSKGNFLLYRILKIKFKFITEDGSSVESILMGEAMDSGDKATNKALSVAHKYAILQMFAIPTEDAKDPEHDSPSPIPKQEDIQLSKTEPKKSEPVSITKEKGDLEKTKGYIARAPDQKAIDEMTAYIEKRSWTPAESIALQGFMVIRKRELGIIGAAK